ncbi:MAG: UDP-N-acetylmuramate--L-alanine ligase [Bernardetiaceae bacterium]|nr:UDP-N-acetylmuramate--L-alanine ligase [Bernardetiaceae bacterium]
MDYELQDIDYVYFLGIGGIGMSALARWFVAHGKNVGGYDRSSSEITQQLQALGCDIHFEDNPDLIAPSCKNAPHRSLIVYTPAIPATHREFNFFKRNQFSLHKRAEILGWLTAPMRTVAIAGTHGKTTTSAMLAHLLKGAGVDCAAFLGGISTNLGSNLLLNQKLSADTIAVVEADEFDRSFLHLNPDIALITSTDADHLDIYGNPQSLIDSFDAFIQKGKRHGKLLLNRSVHQDLKTKYKDKAVLYGIENGNRYQAGGRNIRIEDDVFVFDYEAQTHQISNLRLATPGFHNVENMVGAIYIALELGVDKEAIRQSVASYQGVKRRFEYVIRNEKTIYIDDYAHHPVEITAFLRSVRALYPNKKLTAVFQPHLYSRTKDLQEDFARSLSEADCCLLLDIYPARELPIEGINSGIILNMIKNTEKYWLKDKDLLTFIQDAKPELLVSIGAGSIDRLVPQMKSVLSLSKSV